MSSIIIHGHFYQPPRENPWTGAIDREDSAAPFHDWNERIHTECYRANGFARVLDDLGRVERIINNYSFLSFDFGPTLMVWLERTYPRTHGRIVEADRASARAHNGHGNAIAHGYNHAILPLCNERDRRTQVLWGIADFRHRFGRAPESLWLPETACNDATLATLIEAEMPYVILSPHQAQRVRRLGGGEWRDVSDGSIDPRVPYRYFHRDGSGRSIAIFFYDDGMARSIAFEGALASSQNLIQRLLAAKGGDGKLVNVATDGESYGHHFRFGDRCIAYALDVDAPRHGLQITNYGEFLAGNAPVDEVEIKPGPNGEGTAWSCAHGVGRWCRDCGCQTGGQEGWNQAWRGPLRAALDQLRDAGARIFETQGGDLFRDPWAVRDAYIDLVLNPAAGVERFLNRHGKRRLRGAERTRALNLLEMQRASMTMYTSCGWFFADISGIETVQVMRYAARMLDFMRALDVEPPVKRFLATLAEARSNVPTMGNGADVYRRFVQPSRVTPQRLAAHLAISSLAGHVTESGRIGSYKFDKSGEAMREHGRLTLITCQITLRESWGNEFDYAAAALHLGGMDFYCALKQYPGPGRFNAAAETLSDRFRRASLPTLLRAVQKEFGPDEFGIEDVLPDGRWAISEKVFGGLSEDLTAQLLRIYEQDRRVVEMLYEAGFELPTELRLIAEFILGRRFEAEVREQRPSLNPADYRRAARIAEEIERRHYRVDKSALNQLFTEMVAEAARNAVANPSEENLAAATDAIAITRFLRLSPGLDEAQEMIYQALTERWTGYQRLAQVAVVLGISRKTVANLCESPAEGARQGRL